MSKQAFLSLIIGITVGAFSMYILMPNPRFNFKSTSDLNCADYHTAHPWVDKKNVPDEFKFLPKGLKYDAAKYYVAKYLGGTARLGGKGEIYKGWFLPRSLFETLLDTFPKQKQDLFDTIPDGLQCYLGIDSTGCHTLVWGAIEIRGKDIILVKDHLMDYVDPCPSHCPSKDGL